MTAELLIDELEEEDPDLARLVDPTRCRQCGYRYSQPEHKAHAKKRASRSSKGRTADLGSADGGSNPPLEAKPTPLPAPSSPHLFTSSEVGKPEQKKTPTTRASRCGGALAQDEDGPYCLNCGHRPVPEGWEPPPRVEDELGPTRQRRRNASHAGARL